MSTNIVTDKKSQNLIIFSVAFASFMVNLDTYIVNISLPAISRYFHAPTSNVAWVMLSYHLIVTSLLLIFGKLGDRLGLKRVFIFGFFLFTLSSLLCGLAPTLLILILGRFIQGVGASMLYALTPAMIPKFLPPEERGPAFGTLATAAALGITVGTPLGGIITGFSSWHWIFLINIPVGLAAIVVCQKVLPRDQAETAAQKSGAFDGLGALFSFIASLSIMYALSMGDQLGWTSVLIASCFAVSVLTCGLFIYWELKNSTPLLELTLFLDKAFTFGNIAALLAFAFLAGHNFLMPFYLMLVQGLKSEQAGFTFMTYSVVYMFIGPMAGRLSVNVNPRLLTTLAMGLCSLTAFYFAVTLAIPGLIWVLIYFVLLAVSFGTFVTANNSVVMNMAPPGKQGIVSGTFRMINRFGMALGVCIFGMAFSISAGTGHGGKDVFLGLSRAVLIGGFRNAYIVGGIVCLLAMSASQMARSMMKK